MAKLSNLGFFEAVIAVLVFLSVVGVLTALMGWVIMLLWGALASTFDWQTMGYGTSVLVSLGLSVIGSFFGSSSS